MKHLGITYWFLMSSSSSKIFKNKDLIFTSHSTSHKGTQISFWLKASDTCNIFNSLEFIGLLKAGPITWIFY